MKRTPFEVGLVRKSPVASWTEQFAIRRVTWILDPIPRTSWNNTFAVRSLLTDFHDPTFPLGCSYQQRSNFPARLGELIGYDLPAALPVDQTCQAMRCCPNTQVTGCPMLCSCGLICVPDRVNSVPSRWYKASEARAVLSQQTLPYSSK